MLAVVLWTFGLSPGRSTRSRMRSDAGALRGGHPFALALGSAFSLRARSTTRAMVATVGVLFVLNGGYLMCVFPLNTEVEGVWFAPVTWLVLNASAAKYSAVQVLFGTYPPRKELLFDTVWSQLLMCLASLVGYGMAAAILGSPRSTPSTGSPTDRDGRRAPLAERWRRRLAAGRDESSEPGRGGLVET